MDENFPEDLSENTHTKIYKLLLYIISIADSDLKPSENIYEAYLKAKPRYFYNV